VRTAAIVLILVFLAGTTVAQGGDSRKLDALLAKLSSRDAMDRLSAVIGLAEFTRHAGRVVPALSRALADDDARVRRYSAAVLAQFGKKAAEAIPRMRRAATGLGDEPDILIIMALVRLSEEIPEAGTAIVKLLDEKNEELKEYTLSALPHASNLPAYAVKRIVGILETDTPKMRAAAALCLANLKERAVAAVPALRTALSAKETQVRADAALALGFIGAKDEETKAALLAGLDDQPLMVRMSARFSLFRTQGIDTLLVEDLALGLAAEGQDLPFRALSILANVGKKAGRLRGDVEAILAKSPDVSLRCRAVVALAAIGEGNAAAMKTLSGALSDADETVQKTAVGGRSRW